MPVLKPVRGIRLNKSHPLARGLVGYWLLNEGSGNKVFDLSGNGNTGTEQQDSVWLPGKYGVSRYFSGDDYIDILSGVAGGHSFTDVAETVTLIVGINPDAVADLTTPGFWEQDYTVLELRGQGGASKTPFSFGVDATKIGLGVASYNGSRNEEQVKSNTTLSTGIWYQIVVVINGDDWQFYLNGVDDGNGTFATATGDRNLGSDVCDMQIGIRARDAGDKDDQSFNGLIDHVMIYNRALSTSEIALLYREPFCMFDRTPILSGLISGQIRQLAGTSTALSSLSAIAKASRKISGTAAGTSGSTAILAVFSRVPSPCHMNWLTEALFNGMTANAFKLGTSLSLGWFWVRVTGCSVLYRGAGMGEIDFANILAVSERNACEISPPSFISHNNSSTYFYVVRRFNNCGYQEHTLAAAVKVSIGSSGELAEPQPNNIFSSKAEQVASNKVRLAWFYCPLEQGSIPVSFNVYYDDRTGQIDYENPLETIEYKGRRFYSFQSPDLSGEAGDEVSEHLFAIRAEDADGIENISLTRLKIQLDTLNPDAIDILRAEAV